MNIRKLILQGEGTSLDFKKTISNKEKIAKSLVAFANNKGGTLLIGVADDGTIKGVKSEEEEKYMITRAAHQYCRPALEPQFEEIYLDDKLVLAATIPESDTKPHYALDDKKQWWVYYRVQDKSVLASKVMIEVIKQKHQENGARIVYTDKERKLLTYLDTEEKITLKQFCKMTRCSHKKAQQILVNLILAGLIQPHTSEKEEYFSMTPGKLL